MVFQERTTTLKGRTAASTASRPSERVPDRALELNFPIELASTKGRRCPAMRVTSGNRVNCWNTRWSREGWRTTCSIAVPFSCRFPPLPGPKTKDVAWQARDAAIGAAFDARRERERGLRSRGTQP